MLYLVLSVVFSVLLLVNFRAHAKFQVDTRIAILLNYPVCFLTAYFHQPSAIPFHWPSNVDTFLLMAMGVGFVITFLLSGFSTQKNGMAPTSLANNISLVIPVLINLFILKTGGEINWSIALGLFFSFAAIYFCSPQLTSSDGVKPVVWLLLAVFVAYGLTNTLFSYLNSSLTYFVGGTLPFIMMILIGSMLSSTIFLIWKSVNGTLNWNRNSVLAAIPLGLPNFLSFYFLLKALDAYQNNAAVVLTMYNLSVILLSALTAYVFFKERLTNRQWIGLGIGCVGIALLNGL
ncbi:MAG: DMT family transporter [Cytophagales bacterium]|nr:DMT family transporter [Cytophagales bacterium]